MDNGGRIKDTIDVVGKGLDVIKKAQELTDGSITYSFDKQTKRAKKRKDCVCKDLQTKREIFRVLKYVQILGLWDQVRIRLGIRWQYNGCDVIGAIPYLGSSVARMGWSADLKVVAINTDTTSRSTCECCEKSVCVTFQYTITINPLLQGTRTHSGEITVCGDGSSKHIIYN